MIAIISDIHSNVEALSAVLADIDARGVTRIVCLGDMLGYGPQPRECLDMIRGRVEVAMMGNHDYAVMYEPNKFNVGAESACYWTRQQLEDDSNVDLRAERWEFLGSMRMKHVMLEPELGGEVTFVHGSPRRPINEYIFPDDVYNSVSKVQGQFERFSSLCFVGHTHVPGVFLDSPDFYSPDELDGEFELTPGRKALINVGSVGQPRDRDTRASYVILRPGAVEFIRVAYNVEAVVQKVLAVPELDDYLGIRLKEGR